MWSLAFNSSNENYNFAAMQNSGQSPALILLFGKTDELLASKIPLKLQEVFKDAKVIGCSTGTNVCNSNLSNDGFSGLALGFKSSHIEVASEKIPTASDSFSIGTKLGNRLKKDDLVSVFILSDGLNVNGSDIVGGVLSVLGARVKVSGGLAADGARFEKTILIENGEIRHNEVLAIGFYGKNLCVSNGSEGGWQDHDESWLITKSDGNIMHELDGNNAYETYSNILCEQAENLPGSGLLFPLRIWHPNYPQHDIVRTLLAVDKENGTLTFAGDVPTGWRAGLMSGSTQRLVEGAKIAAQKAYENFHNEYKDVNPNVCFLVSCVGRRLLLGKDTQNELNEIKSNLPKSTNLAGFYSYGEIAPHKLTNLCSLHNQTVTLTLIGERN